MPYGPTLSYQLCGKLILQTYELLLQVALPSWMLSNVPNIIYHDLIY